MLHGSWFLHTAFALFPYQVILAHRQGRPHDCKGRTLQQTITISQIIITNYCQLHESLSPWPASTHSKLPLHWALHLIVILTFQVNFYREDGDDDEGE